jgi:4'-phosphopantetheinyl transferase
MKRLASGEVHLWWVHLDSRGSLARWSSALLSPDEHARAARFAFERDRWRFIGTRGALRAILSAYRGVAGSALRFEYAPSGKPSLVERGNRGWLCFNVSHSGEMALVGVTLDCAIGVDVEHIRDDVDTAHLASRFFSAREAAALAGLPARARHEAFFACWTRKEAYLKARGDGLSLPLDGFDVSLAPGEQAALLGTRPDPQEAVRWSVRAVSAPAGFAAALAIAKPQSVPSTIRTLTFNPRSRA